MGRLADLSKACAGLLSRCDLVTMPVTSGKGGRLPGHP